MMKKVIIAAVALVVLVGGWMAASPWWTLRQMRDAAEARDAAALAAYVDFPALREDLKGEFGAVIAREMARSPEQGAAAAGAAFATALAGPMIDAMVTPQGLQAMMAGGDGAGLGGDKMQKSLGLTAPNGDPAIERVSLDEFRVKGEDGNGSMVFKRHGLGWKLSGVDLPEK